VDGNKFRVDDLMRAPFFHGWRLWGTCSKEQLLYKVTKRTVGASKVGVILIYLPTKTRSQHGSAIEIEFVNLSVKERESSPF